MTQYAATPRLQTDCGCLCKPPVADSFSPGTTARVNADLTGVGDSNYREVRAKGLPPVLRMGILAGFLGALGDDNLDLVGMDTGGLLPEPPVFVPQVENNFGNVGLMPYLNPDSPLLDFTPSPTGALQPFSPTTFAQIPSNVQPATSQPGTSIASSAISAASQLLKAKSGTPTASMTPAQIAALQKANTANLGMSQLIPGVTNQNLLLYGGGALLLFVLMGKK